MGLVFAIKATLLPYYLQFSIQFFVIKHFRSMAHILLLFGNSGSRTAHKANQELNLKTPFSSHFLALFFFSSPFCSSLPPFHRSFAYLLISWACFSAGQGRQHVLYVAFFFVSLLLSSSDSSTNPSTGVTQTFTLFLLFFSRHCCAKRKTSTSRLVFIDFARHLHNFVQTVSQIYVK